MTGPILSIKGLQGEKGDTGEKGIDGLQGPQGEKGEQGDIGPQGEQGPIGLAGKDGKDGLDGIDGKDGKDGKDGTPVDIKVVLESLEGDERLDAKAIKGLDKLEKKVKGIERIQDNYVFGANESDPVFTKWLADTPPIYSESDTLQSVTDRGSTTTKDITVNKLDATGDLIKFNTAGTAGWLGYGAGGSTYAGLWLRQASPTFANYDFLADGVNTFINAPTKLWFRIGNTTKIDVTASAVTIAPNTTVTGTISASNLSGTNTGDQKIPIFTYFV